MKIKNILFVAGYVILSSLTLLLFILTLKVKISLSLHFLVLLHVLLLVGLIYGCIREGFNKLSWSELDKYTFGIIDLWNLIAVVVGAVVTYLISVKFQLGPVIAAGLVGTTIALIKPKYGVPVYCGAFVGMACPKYLCSYNHLLFAGIAAGGIFAISKPFFNGFGGKLGTIALAGCLLTGFVMNSPLQSFPIPDWDIAWLIFIYSIAGAVFTYLLNILIGYGPVLASGITGIAGGLWLPVLYPENGDTLGVVVICSSFAGMSDKIRFPHTYLMVIAGLFSGIIFMFSLPYLGGAGGKLGTIAFGSVITLHGIINIIKELKTSLLKKSRFI